ncbi:unnamed protein product [marine sediment metagenome]|uniref:Uncharacterized protein n=1 Tax=marine sediment metagenome TaxID=412755 RepID=X1EWX9_9ZZZZ
MSELEQDIRLFIEEAIDKCLSKPLEEYETRSKQLASIGIEPNLETVLSYISGLIMGVVVTYTLVEKVNDAEVKTYIKSTRELLERRAWELREAFSRARFT